MTFARWNQNNSTNWQQYISSDETLTASDLDDTLDETIPPIGTIIGWAKSLTGVPATLPTGWKECDGSTISDADSPLNGQALPNLNGNNNFLRGATTSGGTGGSNSTHTHTYGLNSVEINYDPTFYVHSTSSITTDAKSIIPPYYRVVFIMRIK